MTLTDTTIWQITAALLLAGYLPNVGRWLRVALGAPATIRPPRIVAPASTTGTISDTEAAKAMATLQAYSREHVLKLVALALDSTTPPAPNDLKVS